MRAHHVHVEHTLRASRPSAIFAYLAEHENLAEVFGAKITRLRDGEDGERNGVGSVRQLQIGPVPPFEETVTEFVPPERIVYRITKGSPLRGHVGVMTFDPDGRAARASSTTSASPRRSPGLALLVRASLTRSINASAARRSSSTPERPCAPGRWPRRRASADASPARPIVLGSMSSPQLHATLRSRRGGPALPLRRGPAPAAARDPGPPLGPRRSGPGAYRSGPSRPQALARAARRPARRARRRATSWRGRSRRLRSRRRRQRVLVELARPDQDWWLSFATDGDRRAAGGAARRTPGPRDARRDRPRAGPAGRALGRSAR